MEYIIYSRVLKARQLLQESERRKEAPQNWVRSVWGVDSRARDFLLIWSTYRA